MAKKARDQRDNEESDCFATSTFAENYIRHTNTDKKLSLSIKNLNHNISKIRRKFTQCHVTWAQKISLFLCWIKIWSFATFIIFWLIWLVISFDSRFSLDSTHMTKASTNQKPRIREIFFVEISKRGKIISVISKEKKKSFRKLKEQFLKVK